MILEVFLGGLLTVVQHHERLQALAELLVLDADRRRLRHRVVAGQDVLNLFREHVLAAGDDHLVVATFDEHPPGLVEAADVACGHQALDHVLAAAAGVALEQHLVSDEDPARLPLKHLPAVVVVEVDD